MLQELGEELVDEKDIWQIFELFVSGEPNKNGFKVSYFKLI